MNADMLHADEDAMAGIAGRVVAGAAAIPFAPASLSRAEAARAGRIGRHRAALTLPGQEALLLSIQPGGAAEDGTDGATEPGWRVVDLTLGEVPFQAFLPGWVAADLLRSLVPAMVVDGLPPALAGMLLEAAILNVIVMWEKFSGQAVRFQALRDAEPGSAEHALALIVRKPSGVAWPIRVSAAPETLDLILRPWPGAPRALDRLPVPARLRAGVTTLGGPVLRSLRPGDFVRFAVRPDEPGGATLVIAEALGAPIVLQHGAWTLLRPPGPIGEEWLMSGDAPGNAPGDARGMDGELDDLPVRLAFDLGQVDMPLAELRGLGPGAVIELGRATSEFVDIRANGRRVGQGELVEVEGALGVRITRIFARE